MKKYKVTGWIQSTDVIDQIVWAESESDAIEAVYDQYSDRDVNNNELEAEEIESDPA